MKPSRLLIPLFFLLAVCLVHADDKTNPTFARLRAEHDRVLHDMNTKCDNGKPMLISKTTDLLDKGWDLAGQWAAAYLNERPKPTRKQLEHIFDGFAPEPKGVKSKYGDFLEYDDYSFEGSAIRIGEDVYVVQARYWMEKVTGAFFVLARGKDGKFQPWSIKEVAKRHYRTQDEIGRWYFLSDAAYVNGPLAINNILRLFPTADGHPRFLVDTYTSTNGGTNLGQLSIWEWNGVEAVPQLIDVYESAVDFRRFRFLGKKIEIGTKEGLNAFFSAGSSPEPRGIWTIELTANGVKDLGRRFLQPEIQWADKLLSKIAEGGDTKAMARPEVTAKIKAVMEDIESEQPKLEGSEEYGFMWGEFSFQTIQPVPQGVFDLNCDEAHFRFSYVMRGGKPYFTKVRVKKTF